MNSNMILPTIAAILVVALVMFGLSSGDDGSEGVSDVGLSEEEVRENLEDEYPNNVDLTVDAGWENDGYIFVELVNQGMVALPIENRDLRVLDLYHKGEVESWTYAKNELNQEENITVGAGSGIVLNTSIEFPDSGDTRSISFEGIHGTSTSMNCYSDGSQAC